MAIKKIQLYKNNVDGTETLLNPLTKASYVTMEDGTLIEEALTNKDSSKYTPSIESSKSMFKVGQGDSVDLSSSVVDGAYNSCVIKGRTLVNIASKVINKPVNSTTDNTTFTLTTYTDKWQTVEYDKSLLKTNTKYTIFLTVLQNDGSHTLPIKVQLGNGSGGYLDVKKGYTGRLVATLTTMSEIPDTLSIGLRSSTIAGEVVKVSNFIVLEGDYSNEDFPYFTGMCDVKSPILSNVGKNLFDIDAYFEKVKHLQGVTRAEDGLKLDCDVNVSVGNAIRPYRLYENFDELTSYTISFERINTGSFMGDLSVVYTDGTSTRILDSVTTPSNKSIHYVEITWATQVSGGKTELKNIQIEKGVRTTYEPYKSNILTCDTYFDEVSQSDKTIVLRSLPNGTCDTLNVETGEYVQRIGEVVLDGSSDESFAQNSVYLNFYFVIADGNYVKNSIVLCDKLPYTANILTEQTGVKTGGSESIQIKVSGISTTDELKTWLQSNPITVQYQLATPIVKTVNLSGFPYAYKDGHVILESGSVEQSLTPKVGYSLVANRNGQIEANTKRVMAHQKELDNFEALMLTQIVQSHYEQTLLQFDYGVSTMTLREG